MPQKKHFIFFRFTFIACLIVSINLIIFHEKIFFISKDIIPNDIYSMTVEGDKSRGGKSTATWINKNKNKWQCSIAYQIDFPFCFFQVYLSDGNRKGMNLDTYQEVKVGINYQGNAPTFIFYLQNFNPEYSTESDYGSFKYNRVEIANEEFINDTVTVNFEEFTVADWWLDKHTLPRKLRYRELNNIVTLGIQIQLNHGDKRNRMYSIDINKIEFIGHSLSKEQLYLYIILFWGAFIVMLSSIKFYAVLSELSFKNNNIIKLNKNKRRLEKLSRSDPLTSLNNRAGIEYYLNTEIMTGELHEYTAVALIDIDLFKSINDTYGHDVGDSVLKELAVLLNSSSRIKDCVGRWGGEEFVILWPDMSVDHAMKQANDLCKKVSSYVFDIPDNTKITISIGLSEINDHTDFEQAIKSADNNLYLAKSAGRNCVINSKIKN